MQAIPQKRCVNGTGETGTNRTLSCGQKGFRAQGYEVSLNGGRESIDRLLTLLGQKRGLRRDWLLYNACRMLDCFKSDEVADRVNSALKSGTGDEKSWSTAVLLLSGLSPHTGSQKG